MPSILISTCLTVLMVRRIAVVLQLIIGNIECNPGPTNQPVKSNLTLRTYNCNGLGDNLKLRRVLAKSRVEVNNCGIVLLQETHIVDEKLIDMYWKMQFTSSCASTRRGGVII